MGRKCKHFFRQIQTTPANHFTQIHTCTEARRHKKHECCERAVRLLQKPGYFVAHWVLPRFLNYSNY